MGSDLMSSKLLSWLWASRWMRLGFDAALRALVPIIDWVRAWRGVGSCLALVVLSRLGVLDAFFGACLGWNVAFVRKGLF